MSTSANASPSASHLTFPQPSSASVPQASTSSFKPATPAPVVIRRDRLYVGNLHPSVDEYTLLQLFSKYGKISKLDFLFNKSGPMKGKPRGYAFVEYGATEDASRALVGLHDKLVRGRKLVVTFAQQQPSQSTDLPSGSSDSRTGVGPRRGTDTTRPTTLSLIKTHNRPASTSDKIAALEAKLRRMQAEKAVAEGGGSDTTPPGSAPLAPEMASAMGILPPKPPKPTIERP